MHRAVARQAGHRGALFAVPLAAVPAWPGAARARRRAGPSAYQNGRATRRAPPAMLPMPAGMMFQASAAPQPGPWPVGMMSEK